MARLVILVSCLAAGTCAKRLNSLLLHSQAIANRPGIVPGPVQSFPAPPSAMMGGASVQAGVGRLPPMSPSMSMKDDKYVPDLRADRKNNSQTGLAISRRLLLTAIPGSFSVGLLAGQFGQLNARLAQVEGRLGQLNSPPGQLVEATKMTEATKALTEIMDDLSSLYTNENALLSSNVKEMRMEKRMKKSRIIFDSFAEDGLVSRKDLPKALRVLGLRLENPNKIELPNDKEQWSEYKNKFIDFEAFANIISFSTQRL